MLAVGGAALVSPPAAALVLAVGLLVAGVALPALADRGDPAQRGRRVAPLRGALAADAVDLTHGAADLAAFGAYRAGAAAAPTAGARGWPGWNAGWPPPGSRWTRPGCWSPG